MIFITFKSFVNCRIRYLYQYLNNMSIENKISVDTIFYCLAKALDSHLLRRLWLSTTMFIISLYSMLSVFVQIFAWLTSHQTPSFALTPHSQQSHTQCTSHFVLQWHRHCPPSSSRANSSIFHIRCCQWMSCVCGRQEYIYFSHCSSSICIWKKIF